MKSIRKANFQLFTPALFVKFSKCCLLSIHDILICIGRRHCYRLVSWIFLSTV